VCLTLKNYKFKEGLSSFLTHDIKTQSQVYEIKGPMGKGLDIEPTGEYIAFAAGTGVLVFIDIVSHLVLRLLQEYENNGTSELEPECDKIDLD